METSSSSKPLATESFSYSWLCNNNKSPAANNVPEEPLLRETSCISSNGQNFNFDISVPNKSLDVLVHADELFSDGLIKPVFVEPCSRIVDSCSNNNTLGSCNQITNKPSPCSFSPGVVVSPRTVETHLHHHHHGFLRKCKTSTGRKLRSLFSYVSQLGKIFGCCCSRKYCVRVDDIDNKKEWQVKWWNSSQQASPKSSITVHPLTALHNEHENSIYEAVLHCKRSILAN